MAGRKNPLPFFVDCGAVFAAILKMKYWTSSTLSNITELGNVKSQDYYKKKHFFVSE